MLSQTLIYGASWDGDFTKVHGQLLVFMELLLFKSWAPRTKARVA